MKAVNYVIINSYGCAGDQLAKDDIADAFVHDTGEGTNVSTEDALGKLIQIMAEKGLINSDDFAEIIGLDAEDVHFSNDKNCPY